MKEQVLRWLMDQVKQYGLPFVLLALAVWFFYKENNLQDSRIENLHTEIQECNDRIIDMYSADHIKMVEVISKNTQAIENLSK